MYHVSFLQKMNKYESKINIFIVMTSCVNMQSVDYFIYQDFNNRVFRKLTDLTFLSFFYKINIMGFQNQQKKIASTGY